MLANEVCYLKISSVKFRSQLHEEETFCFLYVVVFFTWPDDFFKKAKTCYNVQGYYKRNRHFQCCIGTKLLMISQNTTYMVL